jgi:heme exporter protein B
MLKHQLPALIKKEFLLEFRQRSTLAGIAVYIIATVFISALSFKQKIHPIVWNALFWVIFTFITVNVSGKSFVQETKGKALYNYLYYGARQFILGKIIYNMMLMAVLSLFTFFFYGWFVGNIVQDMGLFMLVLLFSSTAFSGVLSLMSAIASKSGNNMSLMAILSFPVLMPLLLVSIKVSKNAIDGLAWSVSYNYLLILVMLNFVVITLATLLFNYLWRE